MAITDAVREQIARRLHAALDTFGSRIETVSVALDDVNGPRGGVDKSCYATATVKGIGDVLVKASAASTITAVSGAIRRLKYRVSERIRRKQDMAGVSIRTIRPAA